jgi:hypothetical protein
LALFLLAASWARAEIYGGIGAQDTLGDIKQRFPAAKFERLKPPWAPTWDVLYSITGPGLAGEIVVNFFDLRTDNKNEAYELAKRRVLPDSEARSLAAAQAKINDFSDDKALVVDWVRWVPDRPIPLQRFLSQYGSPTKGGFSKDDLQPYRDWTAQGLTAYLDDAEKSVVRVDYTFTDEEQCQAGIASAASMGFTLPCVERFPKLRQQK